MVVLGTLPSPRLGLFLAGVLRAEATLAAANLVYLLLMAGGAVVLPSSAYGAFGHVAAWLPSGALGDGLRSALINGALDLALGDRAARVGAGRHRPDREDVLVGVSTTEPASDRPLAAPARAGQRWSPTPCSWSPAAPSG